MTARASTPGGSQARAPVVGRRPNGLGCSTALHVALSAVTTLRPPGHTRSSGVQLPAVHASTASNDRAKPSGVRSERTRAGRGAVPKPVFFALGRACAWQHRGNSRRSRCVRCVWKTGRSGRFGRWRTYLAGVYKVEGLVGFTARGGSSPLERMSFRWKSMVSRGLEAARESSMTGPRNGLATPGSAPCLCRPGGGPSGHRRARGRLSPVWC